MLEAILEILRGFTFFFLHLDNTSSFPKALSASRERQLLQEFKLNGSTKARAELIEHNLRLVAHIIKKYYVADSEQDDLISIGTIGLIKGIDSFNISKGTKLATYAARCIENEILMYFRSKKKDSCVMSFEEPIETDSEGNPLTLMDIICKSGDIADDIDTKQKVARLYEIIDKMPDEREKEIIISRYGLFGSRCLSQREIAQKMNISRSYVSRLEKKALLSMREQFFQ